MSGSQILRLTLIMGAIASLGLAQSGPNGYGNGGRGGSYPASGGRTNPGPRDSLGGRPYPVRTDLPPPTGLIPPAASYTGIAPGGSKTIGPRSRGSFVPFLGSSIYYPGAYGYAPSTVAPYNDPSGDVAMNSNMMAAQDAMVEQIRQLTADLQQMKASAPAPPPVDPPSPTAPAASAAPETVSIPIRIILNSGEQFTSKSYAVMNGMLWDFSANRVRKVPVSSVDIAASTKATEAQGGEFPQLRGN